MIWTCPVEQEKSQYFEEELERYEKSGAKTADIEWLQSEHGQLMFPEKAQWKILKGLQQNFPKALGLANYVTQLLGF